MNFEAIYKEALEEAQSAYVKHITERGEGFMCGFAWVEFDNGRAKFVNWLKKNGIGSKHWRKGYLIWNPAKCATQSIDALECSAMAFSNVLRKHGIDCHAASRYD